MTAPKFDKAANGYKMTDGSVFRGLVSTGSVPEVYGWLERDHDIIRGTGGYWRTPDLAEAAKRCAAIFDRTLVV